MSLLRRIERKPAPSTDDDDHNGSSSRYSGPPSTAGQRRPTTSPQTREAYMDLKEFVKSVLVDIAGGVGEAQKAMPTGARVNPPHDVLPEGHLIARSDVGGSNFLQKIDFDVVS